MTLTNTAVRGNYDGSATDPQALGVVIFSGEFSADGASPTGTITGTEDIGAPSGANTGMSVSASVFSSSEREGNDFRRNRRQRGDLDSFTVEIHCLVVE